MDNHHFTYPKVTPVPRPAQASASAAEGNKRPPLQDPPRNAA